MLPSRILKPEAISEGLIRNPGRGNSKIRAYLRCCVGVPLSGCGLLGRVVVRLLGY
jgi:hypothetical protein